MSDSNYGEIEPIYPGQWRLSKIEVYNWGTFNGLHTVPVSREGALFTGESGSGKSTLLDAMTTVLTPPRKRHLNAAARSDGDRGEDRTIASYVRGAWGNRTSDSGEVTSTYLRARGAVWSGILLRYESGDESRRPINLVALFHMKAGTTGSSDASQLFAVVRDEASLADLSPCAANGIDLAKFNRDFKDRGRGYRQHGPFASHFTRLLGMRDVKSLELLHRTQAAKNFGSLDDLLRRFMLEEPRTFDRARLAIDQFGALDAAYRGVVDQREQMECLLPLESTAEQHEVAAKALAQSERYAQVLAGFTDRLALDRLRSEQEGLLRELDGLDEERKRLDSEQRLADQALGQARQALADQGGFALDTALVATDTARKRVEAISENRTRLQDDLLRSGLGALPDEAEDWGRFVRAVRNEAKQAEQDSDTQKNTAYKAAAILSTAQEKLAHIEAERRHLMTSRTNIPRELDDIRHRLEKQLGLDFGDLVFVAELIDIKPGEERWRGAAERLLAGQGRTLLVAHRYANSVATVLDGEHLGLRFEFEDVPEDIEVPANNFSPNSLVQKLEVASENVRQEYVHWVNRLLRTKFDYICVQSPEELRNHRLAVTLRGQVKRNRRYIKDDRRKIDDKGRWILGSSNQTKIAELDRQIDEARRAIDEAQARADEQSDALHRLRDLVRMARVLENSPWESYDLKTAQADYESARTYQKTLEEASGKLTHLKKVRDDAERRFNAARDALNSTLAKIEQRKLALSNIEALMEGAKQRIGNSEAPGAEESQALKERFVTEGLSPDDDTAEVYRISNSVSSELTEEQRRFADAKRRAQSTAERIIADYRRQWNAEAANLTAEFAELPSYLKILRRIQSSGLPEHEQDFLRVLHDFSQEQITAIAAIIRNAVDEVKERIAQVNASLALSEYAPGIHLEIVVKESRSAQADAFLKELRAITDESWNSDELTGAEASYRRSAAVIDRLRSGLARENAADRTWAELCLDTRLHVSFLAKEIDAAGEVRTVHASDRGLSGGQKQKLVIFCLAAALRYQLAEDGEDVPSFGTVAMDEAFDKADTAFAETALSTFEDFGFQPVLATPGKMVQVAESHVGNIVYFHCEDGKRTSTMNIASEPDLDADVENGSRTGEPMPKGADGESNKSGSAANFEKDKPHE